MCIRDRFPLGEEGGGDIDRFHHFRNRFTDGESPDRVSVKIQGDEIFGRFFSEVRVTATLDDAKIVLVHRRGAGRSVRLDPIAGADGPPLGAFKRFFGVDPLTGERWAFIEDHADVAPDGSLNLKDGFRGQKNGASIEVALKTNSFLGDLAEFGERKDLVPSRVGEDGAIPLHERMQSPEIIEHGGAGAEKEVIGVPQKDAGIERGIGQFTGMHRFYRAAGSYGHESRCLDFSMGEHHPPATSGSLGVGFQQRKHGGRD